MILINIYIQYSHAQTITKTKLVKLEDESICPSLSLHIQIDYIPALFFVLVQGKVGVFFKRNDDVETVREYYNLQKDFDLNDSFESEEHMNF